MSTYQVVLIDDDPTVCDALVSRGKQIGFEIKPFSNLKDGLEALRSDPGVCGLILDGHCKIDAQDEAGYDFIPEAQREIDALENSHDRHIYTLINTSHSDLFEKFYGSRFDVIHKSKDPSELFVKLTSGILALDDTVLRERYAEEIQALGQVFPEAIREMELLTVIRKMNSQDIVQIEATLNTARKLLEALLDKLVLQHGLPDGLDRRSQIEYLSGRKYWQNGHRQKAALDVPILPEYIQHGSLALWKLGSAASHLNNNTVLCTRNTTIAVVHLLLELIHWVAATRLAAQRNDSRANSGPT